MARRNKARYFGNWGRSLKSVRYQNQTWSITFGNNTSGSGALSPLPNGDGYYWGIGDVVPATSVAGMRKVKNFTVTITGQEGGTAVNYPTYWLLVYVPEGQNAAAPTLGYGTAGSIYEPNQNVIMSGVVNFNDTSVVRTRNRLARNLNDGDSIQLLIVTYPTQTGTATTPDKIFGMTINYAITFN